MNSEILFLLLGNEIEHLISELRTVPKIDVHILSPILSSLARANVCSHEANNFGTEQLLTWHNEILEVLTLRRMQDSESMDIGLCDSVTEDLSEGVQTLQTLLQRCQ